MPMRHRRANRVYWAIMLVIVVAVIAFAMR
jgi:hypothetical protein